MDDQRFKGAEYERELWECTAHENTTPQDLLKPDYWAHVSNKLRPRARITAWAHDGTWMAEYVVKEAGRTWARVHLLAVHNLGTADVAQSQAADLEPYEIKWRGPHCKWSVVRKSDHEVVHEGEGTQQGCTEWLQERVKADKR